MQKIKADIYLETQCPRIGSGWRRVYLTVGNRYVRVKDIGSGRVARIKTPVFRTLKVTAPRSRWSEPMQVLP